MTFFVRRSGAEHASPPGGPLRLVSEILGSVTHAENQELPRILSQILEAVRATTGLHQGQILLFDYAFNEVYVLEEGPQSTPVRSKLSEATREPGAPAPLLRAGESRPTPADSIEIPVAVGTRKLGLLCLLSRNGRLELGTEDRQLLDTLASLAAIAIDRRRRRRDSLRLQDWLGALWGVFTASQVPGTEEDIDRLLGAIADNALRISCADFVVLYEYLEERGEVRLPPVLAGSIRDAAAFQAQDRGRLPQPEILRLLQARKPFFSERTPEDWLAEGLIDDPAAAGESSFFLHEGVVSSAGIPLRLDQERVGILLLNYRTVQDLNQDLCDQLELFANYAALAIGNARQFLRSQSLSQKLSALIQDAVVAVDRKGRITEFNAEAAALFKHPQTMRGESVVRLYWGGLEEAARIQALLKKKGKIRDEEIFGRTADGEKVPISLTASLLRNESGEWVGSVGILQDLRLQSLRGRTRLLVKALREISDGEELDRIVEMVVFHGIDLLYADAGALFLRVNETTFDLRGAYGAAAELQRPLEEGSARGRLAELANTDPRRILFLPEEGEPGELRLLPESLSSVVVPIRTDARLLGFLLIESLQRNHFSADQKLLEILASQAAVSINRVQLLRYREETRQGLLVSANAVAVGQIATSFIHEAKNSLNGMSLTVHNLLDDIESEPDLKAKKDYVERLSVVLTEMERLDGLSRRLQRFTRQGLRPEKREVYLNDIVESARQLLESVLHRKHMRFETRLDPSLDRPARGRGNPVRADESQIQQVLMNLILNAVAASPERSPLIIETRSHADQVEIRVTDYGEGITGETKRNLFAPFFTTKTDGVGLGLFISRLMVEENHGGRIEIVHTAPGKGSTFSVRLPRST